MRYIPLFHVVWIAIRCSHRIELQYLYKNMFCRRYDKCVNSQRSIRSWPRRHILWNFCVRFRLNWFAIIKCVSKLGSIIASLYIIAFTLPIYHKIDENYSSKCTQCFFFQIRVKEIFHWRGIGCTRPPQRIPNRLCRAAFFIDMQTRLLTNGECGPAQSFWCSLWWTRASCASHASPTHLAAWAKRKSTLTQSTIQVSAFEWPNVFLRCSPVVRSFFMLQD